MMLENSLKQDRLLRHAVLYDRQCMTYGWMHHHMNCYTYTLLQKRLQLQFVSSAVDL